MKRLIVTMMSFIFLATVMPASVAMAQNDHLSCYKIKDSTKFSALADLSTLVQDPPFPPAAGCKIAGKAKQFCVPVDKNNVQESDAPGPDPNYFIETAGQTLTNDFICYKVKCPKLTAPISDTEVTDQFDTRVLTKFKSSTICTPAVKTCGGSEAPQCNGVCPFGDPCIDMGGTCGCN
ncbi:MAG: hypothetical protein E4H03_00280 [Myxococcales bacterium]|jgi:hypothetical protein|nr:MAG: hypothetical protein E4H03_00280 [Myxococcales bacterium]